MPVILRAQPDVPPMTGPDFRATTGPFSVALDGFVGEGPWYDDKGPWRNFNHHEGVDRLCVRSTCGQVMFAIRQGLFDRYRDESGPLMTVYVNDCDEDVCASWFLLKNHHLAQQVMNPNLNRLIHMVDALDTTAGAYPFPKDLPILRELAWIFEPYRRARGAGLLTARSPSTFEGIIEDVSNRILSHIVGKGGALPLDTAYERIGGGTGWVLVREDGAQARTGMFADGVRAFVAARDDGEGRWTYVVGRMSDYVQFPVPAILDALNAAEGCTGPDRWGGGSTIGGSPRIAGSRLTPEEVSEVVESVVSDLGR